MQKFVIRKDVYNEIMNQQSREKQDVEKSNPYPRQDHGQWGCKPDLKVVNKLKPKLLDGLKIMNNKQFSIEVDKLYNGKTFDFPDVIRLPNLNKMLAKKMGLNNPNCYFTKKQFIHSRPQRKGSYNQALRIEEFKRIPEIIHSSNVLFWDKRLKNFFIPFYDMKNKDKVNKICFYKDQNGNFAITVSKIDLSNLNNKDYKKVGVGVAPTIHKSLSTYPASALLASPTYNLIIQDVSNMSMIKSLKPDYNGEDMLNKSFDITVTDITENNKNKKIEQVEKALNAIYYNKPFVIKHIKTDNSKHYDDITLRIRGFDKNKIQKAVHKMAFSLDTQIKSAKGEAFIYRSQEELTDRIVSELTEKTKSVYSFLISYFGLPEVRIISKADLKYKGKILYDPESGKPISQAEWKKFVAAIEKFLNRNYTGVGKKIVLSAESLGRILERLSKTNSFEAIQKMPLSGLKYGGKTFDWISNDIKNMQNTFGESIDRMTQARIQVAVDSAAQRITKVTDNMRNDIQQIIIDGIKDRQSKAKISQNLFDKCSGLNRDFQRIADTEIQNNANNAYIKEELFNTPENEKVYFKRFEQVDDNTCKKCRAIEGKIALWSDIPLESERIKDPYADYAIWEGKTDGTMPMSVMHPYCRGGWVRYYPEIK